MRVTNMSSTQPLTFEPVKYPCPEVPFAYYVAGATKYPEKQRWVLPPIKPTPEAVAKAQFVDKTYQWNGSAAAKAARSQPRN